MRSLRRLIRFFFVRHRSLTVLTAVFFVALILAFANGFWLLSRLANVILIAIPVAYLWTRINLRGLEVTVERPADRLQEGNDFEERITVVNRDWFSKLWLEVEDPAELPGHNAKRVITLGPRQRRTWRTVTPCTRRGRYSVGPVRVTSGDLFGLFRRSRSFGARQEILVYPRAVELPDFSVPPAMLPGEGRFRRPTQQVTPNAAGIREYQPGDSFNRIHWRSTARTGNLMVKLFELDPASDIWLVLDLQRGVQAGEGDEGTEEHAVRIAASIARYFLMANRSVGFMAHGDRFHVQEAQRGLSHYTRILESLALVRAEGDLPLADLLTREGQRFGRHTTLVVITPSTDESWLAGLQLLASHGARLAVVLLETRNYG
ncbi:MAG: DUF58 domain-containing protein, partial [Chloroflexi bacterium]|nr:DUF58 domain-containing protein [Chloroflexota bacterium]